MSVALPRSDTSVLGRWWWTVDRWNVAALLALICFGAVLALAASPSAAGRIGLESYHFIRQQLVLLPTAAAVIVAVSLMSPNWTRRFSVLLLLIALVLTAGTLAFGPEYKGAHRWLRIAGLSMQPSEFLKPALAVFCGWMFAQQRLEPKFPGNLMATLPVLLAAGLLLMQPDIGMAMVIIATWLCQFFLAGLPVSWIGAAGVGSIGMLAVAYHTTPHVALRIDAFIHPGSADTYQVDKSLGAFMNGGVFGRGPGEGTVKALLPDAHSDFVFAVAGEEFGLVACLLILATYGFIVLRGFGRALNGSSLFVLFATTGLLAGFGLQALVNMASSLRLVPTKGMTLPFISYGGSSALALAVAMGMMLALTRRRVGLGEPR